MSIKYEWSVESVTDDVHEDCDDVIFVDSYADALRMVQNETPDPGYRFQIMLVMAKYDEYGDLLDRQWAEVLDGQFEDGTFDNGAKVPQKFIKEVAAQAGPQEAQP